MKLWVVIIGTFWLSGVALMMFMLAAFNGGALANGGKTTPWMMTFLDASIYALPVLSLVAMAMLWVAYFNGWGAVHYWWLVFPIPFAVGYLVIPALIWKQ